MNSHRNQKPQNQRLKKRILNAARKLFLSRGYAGVTMRLVAREIGYSPTTLYLHFKNKSELLTELVEEHNQRLHDEYRRILAREIPTLHKLLGMLQTYIRNGLASPDHFRLISYYYPEIMEVQPDRSKGFSNYSAMCQLVDRLKEEGHCREINTHLVVRSLWAGAYGITSLMILRADLPWGDREEMGRNVMTTLLQGMLTPGTEIPDWDSDSADL